MAEWVHLDVLAIAAHPDDVEITCGGLLISMARKGRSVGVLDLTQGEKGTLGDEKDRAKEAAAAAEVMGLSWRGNLALPDSALEHVQPSKLKIAEIIRGTRPELVILPHWEQRHPDHLACSKLGYDACFFAGLKKMELDGIPHRPRKILYASYYRNDDYSFLFDVSDVFEQKCRAVSAYKSQFGDPSIAKTVFQPGADIYELMRAHDGWLGSRVGVQYAEPYTIKEHILVDDPQKMPVASI